ncbi:putative nuclease HARBI1 [Ischnura elegans]|uniref:putative nuclease HARBI1 n=1 Tax=Ischnura elegans TaxID=197161 RepID=UPI001ED8AEA8|nr:putative nuclease HARBI1 [Ischnura elegans]
MDIVTRWPGSTHDARIFHNRRLKLMLERRELKGFLLGDRGYPQLPYLYTPLANPMTAPERRYNVAHIATRCIVERTFGVWKRGFPCLSMKLRTKLQTTVKIVSACAILHNIARLQRDDLPDIAVNDVPDVAANMRNRRGAAERAAFIQRHFGQV